MLDPKYTKAVSSVMTIQSEQNTAKIVQDSALQYMLCDRDDLTDNKGHYFVSLGLPTALTKLGTGSTVSLLRPELQQLNVDQIIIAPITGSSYSEITDGRSFIWNVPQSTGAGYITLYSSTYTSDKPLKSETNALLGDNVVFLFSDSISKPFSGYTIDEIGQRVSHAANTTWEPDSTNYLKRPSAVSYSEVKGTSLSNGFGTDARASINYSVAVPSNYPENRSGYNYDIPVGFIVLDKGLMVITHSGITSNFPWTSGLIYPGGATYGGATTAGKKNIYFTASSGGTKISYLSFTDVNTSFKTTAVCLAMPKEFYISNNPTWNRARALSDLNQQTGIINLDPVYVTEIGLYNALGELISVAKLSEPVQKNYINLLSFNIDIEL